jgi:hypothetical protein
MVGGPVAGIIASTLIALVMPLQVLRLAAKVRKRVDRPRTALSYGVLMMVAKWADVAGQIGYVLDRRRGRMARLIEYKRAASPASAVVQADARP